jgi:hypothetical protein
VRLSAGFLLRFFAIAGGLFALWSFGGLGDAYARVVIAVTNPVMEVLSGFSVTEVRARPGGVDVFIRSAETAAAGRPDEIVPFQPREQFSGIIPFLALLGASGALSWRRRLRALAIGLAALFAFHVGLTLMGPYMTGIPQSHLGLVWMRRMNRIIDVVYAFYGLVGYAALPFLLWWALTRGERAGSPTESPPRHQDT